MKREELESKFLNAEKFLTEVLFLVKTEEASYMEAVMSVCDSKEIDPEDLVKLKLISPSLIAKLQEEATLNGMMKPEARLPTL